LAAGGGLYAYRYAQTLAPEQRLAFVSAYQELIASELLDSDRPEAHLNVGLLRLRQQQPAEAEAEYRTALRLDPRFVPALVNLADLDRARGMDAEGAALLWNAIAIEPKNPAVKHSLALLLVRERKYSEALPLFREAAELAPDNTHYSYVYAVALNSSGSSADAIALLNSVHKRHPTDREVLTGLIAFQRDRGEIASALAYANELAALEPGNPQAQRMIQELRSQGR
jgi:Flp pilus assembly protein TadD